MAEERHGQDDVWDVVVVGSGFGGSVVACRAAQREKRVLVLERGRWYRPGEFPRTPLQMATNTWDPEAGLFGLFQLWSFRRMDAVVASGVGGGSLIYANVAMRMPEEWFARQHRDWPLTYADLDEHYGTVEKMLGVQALPEHLDHRVPKAAAFVRAARRAGLEPRRVPLAVSFPGPDQPLGEDVEDGENVHGVRRRTCRLCGECDLGCNEGAKNTLDLTYLSAATSRSLRQPATIRELCEVRRVTPVGDGYEVGYVEHAPDDRMAGRVGDDRGPRARTVRARKVVLAAGALGSTWLLLTNHAALPALSPALGRRFSGNGDALGFLAADRESAVDSAGGPVITHVARAGDHLVEDGGHPVFASWVATAAQPGLHRQGVRILAARVRARLAGRPDSDVSAEVARVLATARTARSTLPVLAMGLDPTTGTMRLGRHGQLRIDWPHDEGYLRGVWATLDRIADAMGWRFRKGLSDWLSRGITAHPLGGVPMGRDRWDGVVDSYGEVYGHPGLFVADGSVVPGPIGANPSLTIAALAERFATKITED
ncbi:GMC oxidoreductase [Pseudonocardia humida]|uniref:Cholesterol oxidase n=1 Tax=Pseudonocardia humida TaxID=2800819 RepID=A0ABT1A611_9PSEU|nr:GMC family oxidoreductase [Pseudonocardia humida]MCO1658415.1 GMC family oxidoreductase [Pseudonocardia humida]